MVARPEFNVANVLGATLAAYLTNLALPAIRCSLRNFNNTHESTPGRQNIFHFKDFQVMMDYAHNPHGVRALGEFINNMEVSYKIGVITGVGDRRNEDIIALGEEAAKIFDTIIIRLRGRTDFEIGSVSVFSTFSLERKGGAKSSRPLKPLRVMWPASARQQSDALMKL
jgi:cyanophycin synthetase